MPLPRVISLLPSATEILCAIGGEKLLVGRSHECDYPPSIQDRPVLTGQKITEGSAAEIDAQVRAALATTEHSQPDSDRSLYTLDIDLLRTLKPDVILTQDLCEVCSIDLATVRACASELDPVPQIVSLNPKSIDDVFDNMLRVSEALGGSFVSQGRDALIALRERYWIAREYVNPYTPGPNVAFLEWMEPLFAGGHWTPELIGQAGGSHPLNPPGAKSRQVQPEELIESMPERMIVCPCGFDLVRIKRDMHLLTSQRWWKLLPAVQDARVMLVDGSQMFNRPGPRLIDALEWLVGWLNDRPELTPTGFPARPFRG